jgi:DNA-directed RNA polymerase subunit RPC12/RpoP
VRALCGNKQKGLKVVFRFLSEEEFGMAKCDICGKNGEDLSLVGANHKKLGYIKICSECWEKLYGENEFIGGTTSGGSGVSCPTCG